jgi:dihydrofolate synthase/folylpolyglutamate synthase
VLVPCLTVITDISYDHVEILGSTLRKIASEKAGIIKPGVPNLIGLLPDAAKDVIRETCRDTGAPFCELRKRSFQIDRRQLALAYHSNGFQFQKLKPSLQGLHQLRNTALALEAAGILKRSGIKLTSKAIRRGIESTYWPGRFQIVEKPGRPLLVLDVGHNAGGVAAFVDSFRLKFPGRKAHIIAGFVKRKRHHDMFDSLSQVAESFALVPLRTRRSSEVSELLTTIDWQGIPVRRERNVWVAYKRLLNSVRPDDIIVIIGSHYLVGEFLASGGVKP